MKGIRITVENEILPVEMPEDADNMVMLDWMREQIGGHIEEVHPRGLPQPYMMLVDEEGLMKDDPQLNEIASYLYGYQDHGQVIAGNVLILREKMTNEGLDLGGIRDEDVDSLVKWLKEIAKTKRIQNLMDSFEGFLNGVMHTGIFDAMGMTEEN